MNKDTLILAHWDMVDCLLDEIYLGQHDDKLHGPEMIEEMFRYFASHDARFNAVGFRWNQRGFMAYANGKYEWRGEAAIAAFLGLSMTEMPSSYRGIGPNPQRATSEALRLIYKRFTDQVQAREWMRWHVQKLHGYTCKAVDMWLNYPRRFPVIVDGELKHWTQL